METQKVKERPKKKVSKNSSGLDSRMLPRQNKVLAIYKMFEVGQKDPLTGQEILPPPVILPSTYTLYDKYEEDANKRLKVMKSISGVEHRLNAKTKEMEPIEIYKDIEFSGGYLLINTQTQWNTFIFIELHPLNKSNKFRGQYPGIGEAIFERVDQHNLGTSEKVAIADLGLDAEVTVRDMGFNDCKVHASAMGIKVEDVKSDEIKWNLRLAAKEDPRKFFATHPEPKHQIRVNILDAMSLGILLYNDSVRKFKLHDETGAFHTVALGKEAQEDLIEHFMSKEGEGDLAELRKLMDE